MFQYIRTQHDCHHDTKLKPEAATAVTEFLMMGGKTPETCWAVNKRQDNILKHCYIWLFTYLNCTMMHGLKTLNCSCHFCLTVLLQQFAVNLASCCLYSEA
jgi:hypothetical protein